MTQTKVYYSGPAHRSTPEESAILEALTVSIVNMITQDAPHARVALNVVTSVTATIIRKCCGTDEAMAQRALAQITKSVETALRLEREEIAGKTRQ